MQGYNLPLTVGLMLCCAYWLISCIGSMEFGTDLDADINPESGGIFGTFLSFLNASEVPLMLVLTLINVYMWTIAMLTNHILNPADITWLALVLLLLNFIISAFLTKFTTKPLIPLFKSMQDDEEKSKPIIGESGKVKSRVLDHRYGQVEILRDKNAPALTNCKLSETDEPLMRGAEVLVVKYDEVKQLYIVRSLTTTHQDKLNEINSESEQPEQFTTNYKQYE